MINWRSSSGSASIVGVMGQMSAALSALPDAWLTSCPRIWRKDEVVTQSGTRRKERKIKKEKRGGHRRDTNTDLVDFGVPVSQLTFQLNCYRRCQEYC